MTHRAPSHNSALKAIEHWTGHDQFPRTVRRWAWVTIFVSFWCVWWATGCTMAKGPGWSYSSLGADVSGLSVSAEGIRADELRQSVALGKTTDTVRSMWSSYLVAEGLKFLAGKYYGLKGDELNAGTTVKLEELRNAKSAADAAAKLEQLKISPPEL